MKKPLLTYCTNVHALESPEAWRKNIAFFAPRIGELLQWQPLPMGLWFNEPVLQAFGDEGLERLKGELEKCGAYTFTLNAFPQGAFHDPVVKHKVYLPDWADPARAHHTRQCAEVLCALLPEEGFGSISTLPLGWRTGWTPEKNRLAAAALIDTARFFRQLRDRTGKTVALALEPEPGCALEKTPQVVDFWQNTLRPAAAAAGCAEAVETHLGLCYDTCHQAVQFEEPEAALEALRAANIPVHKMQLSSALEFPAESENGEVRFAAMRSRSLRTQFVEPRFLHQTRVRTDEAVLAFDDLPEALAASPDLFAFPWRVHFHAPIHAETLLDPAAVRTTRDDMLRALRFALKHGMCSHFEVETYTWSVLPASHRPAGDEALAQCLAQELNFVLKQVPGVFGHG